MKTAPAIMLGCWFAIAMIAITYFCIGGVNFTTNIIVALLAVVGFVGPTALACIGAGQRT